jgi:hypothetical protein
LLALNDIRNLINRPEILSSSDRQGSTGWRITACFFILHAYD